MGKLHLDRKVELEIQYKMITGVGIRFYCKDLDVTDALSDDDMVLIFTANEEFIEIGLECECTGDVTNGTRDYFASVFGNWLPGDPTEVKDIRVTCGGVDLTSVLSHSQTEEIEQALLEVNQEL